MELNSVVILPKTSGKDNAFSSTNICRLRHPRTDEGATYLCTRESVYEVNFFKPKTSCWFIDQTIRSDGVMSVVTQVDPIFMALPYLLLADETGGKKFMMLDQVLVDSEFGAVGTHLLGVLASSISRDQLELIADIKFLEESDFPLVRYSESKTLLWLSAKARSFARELRRRNVDVHGNRSASLVVDDRPKENESPDADVGADLLKYAAEVVSDYLSFELKERLMKTLGVADVRDALETRPEAAPSAKRAKTNEEPSEDYAKGATPFSPAANKKLSKASKDLAKAAKGTASVMSFFKSTPKK